MPLPESRLVKLLCRNLQLWNRLFSQRQQPERKTPVPAVKSPTRMRSPPKLQLKVSWSKRSYSQSLLPMYYSGHTSLLKVSCMFKLMICGLQGPSLWQGPLNRHPLLYLQLRRSRTAAARTARVNLRTRLQLRSFNILSCIRIQDLNFLPQIPCFLFPKLF